METLEMWWRSALETELWGESVAAWATAVGFFLGLMAVFALVKRVVVRRLRRLADKTSVSWDDVAVSVLERTSPWLFAVVALDLAAKAALDLTARAESRLDVAATIALFVQIGVWVTAAVSRAIAQWAAETGVEGGQRTAGAAIVFVVRLAVWSVVLLLVLGNLGVEIGALLAGLGVGGIAAALAVQSALGDLFAGFAIYLDRPFDIGDFIVVEGVRGNIQKIGVRSTHIKSLDGERIVYPNNKLISNVIQNYRRMEERRILFTLGVLYSTPADDLEAAPGIIREVIEAQERARFDRAHFQGFADSALTLEVVYYVLSREYGEYMDVQQAVNLGIVRRFQERGIGFAFPTRTLHLANSGTVPVRLSRQEDVVAAE